MNTLIFKSLHIIVVVTWFAALFYMPRLFVYFAEADQKSETEKNILQAQFKIMQRRLWFGIAWPSAILVFIFGFSLVKDWWPVTDHPWLMIKLVFVAGLYAYHDFLHRIFRQQQQNIIRWSPLQLRIINEISTIFLVAIVFLVIMKDVISMIYGLIGLVVLIAVLGTGIKIYKNIREQNERSVK